MKMKRLLSIAVAAGISLAAVGFTNSNAADPQGKAIGYWTKDRMDSAQSLDVVVDAKTGKGSLVREARGSSTSSSTSNSVGTWTLNDINLKATGKVFFTEGGQPYVCSGSWINDSVTGSSFVLTAGHCVWDQANGVFVTNFIFVPGYMNNASTATRYAATKLFVREEFASQTTFNSIALQNDWGIARVDNYDTQNSYPISFANNYDNKTVSAFGYPQATPYNGTKLINCQSLAFKDSKNSNQTWGINCNMTGGASGGPWLNPWNSTTYSGTAFSVNSYKYNNDASKMYGPMFNTRTSDTFAAAQIGAAAPGVRAS